MSDINYEAVLADLRQRRDKLNDAIAAIEQITGSSPSTSTAPVERGRGSPEELRPDTFFQMSTPDAVKKYLSIVKTPTTAADIAKALEQGGIMSRAKNFYANVSTVVRRLSERGEIVQLPDTKEWALASWYPSRPKPNGGGAKKSEQQGAARPSEGYQPDGEHADAPDGAEDESSPSTNLFSVA